MHPLAASSADGVPSLRDGRGVPPGGGPGLPPSGGPGLPPAGGPDLQPDEDGGYDADLDAAALASAGTGMPWPGRALPPGFGWHPGDPSLADAGLPIGYAAAGKAKARVVCAAFIEGAGGGPVLQPAPRRLVGCGPAVFFGVTEATQHLWRTARAQGRDAYYLDNAYFDAARGRLLRATRNAAQASGDEPPDWARWAALGLRVRPWRRTGRHVLLVAQSPTHMRAYAGQDGHWWQRAHAALRAHTDRPIVVRGWRPDKRALAATLAADLKDCWALVTWSSAAANEALLAGVPVFCAGPCAASRLGLADLARIERPVYPEGRTRWAAALAGRQWSLDEFRAGTAWRTLHA